MGTSARLDELSPEELPVRADLLSPVELNAGSSSIPTESLAALSIVVKARDLMNHTSKITRSNHGAAVVLTGDGSDFCRRLHTGDVGSSGGENSIEFAGHDVAGETGLQRNNLADKPFGEWNAFRIKMIGEHVNIWLNGKHIVKDAKLSNYFDRKNPLPADGPIELQTHGGEIRWRNVFLREIDKMEASKYLKGLETAAK